MPVKIQGYPNLVNQYLIMMNKAKLKSLNKNSRPKSLKVISSPLKALNVLIVLVIAKVKKDKRKNSQKENKINCRLVEESILTSLRVSKIKEQRGKKRLYFHY